MNVFPIFARDLCADREYRRLRKDRLLAGALSGVILVALAAAERWIEGFSISRLGRVLPIAGVLPFVLLSLGLSLGTRLLATERREGTLPLLLLTHLTGHDILFGKLLAALVTQFDVLLAAAPALVLPVLVLGWGWGEAGLTALACTNLLFFGITLGMVAAVFFDESKATTGCLLMALPLLIAGTPLAMLLPIGPLREVLASVQWLNPGEPLFHVQTTLTGVRPRWFWLPLMGSHLFAWGMLAMGGSLLPWACRWRAGRNAGPSRGKAVASVWKATPAVRSRMLNRNPIFWLASRSGWPTVQIWSWLGFSTLFWGWLLWLTWIKRSLNVAIVFVVGLAASWLITFLVTVPVEASRRLVEDRIVGALELLLCTPLREQDMIHGQWLALRRRYLVPLILTMLLSAGLMVSGYVTFGFGGMLDPEDRGLWLAIWLGTLGLLPVSLAAICWLAMRRSLFARNAGEASSIALMQMVGVPCILLACAPMLWHSLFGWNPDWWLTAGVLLSTYAAWLIGFSWHARRRLLLGLRPAAAPRSSGSQAPTPRSQDRVCPSGPIQEISLPR